VKRPFAVVDNQTVPRVHVLTRRVVAYIIGWFAVATTFNYWMHVRMSEYLASLRRTRCLGGNWPYVSMLQIV
jgi:hypothetical protein